MRDEQSLLCCLRLSDQLVDGMVDAQSKADRSFAVVFRVNVLNVVNDGVQQMRLAHSASRHRCRDMCDVDVEMIWGEGNVALISA